MNDRLSKTFKKALNSDHSSTSTLIQRVRSFKSDTDTRPRSDSITSIEELVQCPICLERFCQPRMLPCQHTFCLSCLQGHVTALNTMQSSAQLSQPLSTDKLVLRCPNCNAQTALKNGIDDIEHMPANVYINSLLRLLDTSTEPATPAATQTAEDVRCIKCETICQFECIKCQHCKQIFCKICWGKHTKELEEKLMTLSSQLDDSEMRLNHKVDDAAGRCEQLNEAIRQATEEKVTAIRRKEDVLLKEVHEFKMDEKKSSSHIRDKISELKKTINNLNFERIDENQKVAIFMNLHRNTSKVLDEISRWGETRIIFDSDAFKLEEDNEGLNSEVEESQVDGVRLTVDPLENTKTLVSYYKSKSFSPKLQWTKIPRPAGVAVSPWSNNIYVAGTDTQVILIMNPQKSKVIGRITTPDMLCPHGIAFSKNRKEIYVTDKWKHCIHVFSSFGDYLRSICTKGSSEGKIRSPEGIAVTPDDEIVVCDTGNDRILVLDPVTGKQKTAIGWLGLRTLLNMPTGVAVTDNRKIVVADTGNHRIKVFNMSGTKLMEIGSLGRNKGQFRSAEVVAVDPLGFILVGDAGNSRVQIFDPSGSLVRVFGGAGSGAGKFKWVSGITVTPQLDVITTDYKSRSLQIF